MINKMEKEKKHDLMDLCLKGILSMQKKKGKELLFIDGSKYNGEFKNNLMNGVGEYRWPNGKIYNGE